MQFQRTDTSTQTLVLRLPDSGLPGIFYWGAKLPADESLADLAAATVQDVNGGMLDDVPGITVAPLAQDTFPGQPGMRLRGVDGVALEPRFRLTSQHSDASHNNWIFTDDALSLSYHLLIDCKGDTGVLALRSKLASSAPILVDWLSTPVLPAPLSCDEMLEFSGRWCGEFQMRSVDWEPGVRLRECLLGRTSHEHFPTLIMPVKGCTAFGGEAFAMHYGWSGGHRMMAEQLPDGRRQVQWGCATNHHNPAVTLHETAELFLAYSESGLNGIASQYQRTVRDTLLKMPDVERVRPVHYNCWEAVYFNHDLQALCDIAKRAAALGAERFVLDDGWFAGRNDATSSLGDWVIDSAKYPNGLRPLIDQVHKLGMTFGLWFEPEMVNPDSDLYRQHPLWRLGDEDQLLGRQQMVLDMSMPEVRDYLLKRISNLLSEYPIDYIKWDHNRVLPYSDHQQALGFYQLLDDLRERHSEVEIESCSSGGGRIDYGVIQRTHRVWLSDSNDALERFWMQRNAALFLPALVTGSHVGPRICHTSGRELPIEFRAWVAASRHMGFEMDPRELTEHETDVLSSVTAWYKANRDWMHQGIIQRIESDDPAVLAEMHLDVQGDRFVVFMAQMSASAQNLPLPLRLGGLNSNARYQINLVNKDQQHGISRGAVALKKGPLELSGRALMQLGIQTPNAFPATMWVIEGNKL